MLRRLWGLFVFLIAAGALGASGYLYQRLQREAAERAALAAQVAAFGPAASSSSRPPCATSIGTCPRRCSRRSTSPPPAGSRSREASTSSTLGDAAGKGTKIAGKVINPTSVTHEDAKISVRIGVERATFTLPRVPPGVAQPFEVALPDVAARLGKKALTSRSRARPSASRARRRGSAPAPSPSTPTSLALTRGLPRAPT